MLKKWKPKQLQKMQVVIYHAARVAYLTGKGSVPCVCLIVYLNVCELCRVLSLKHVSGY